MLKATIVVLSDPNGGEESLGRVFNALAAAFDFKRQQRPVEILFQGTGTRWVGRLERPDHPAHSLYLAVQDKIRGASAGCAAVFGAQETVARERVPFIADNPVPGTAGLASLVQCVDDGPVMTF